MSDLKFFTLSGYAKTVIADSSDDVNFDPETTGVYGRLTITPKILGYPVMRAETLAPPTLLVLGSISAVLDGGRIKLRSTQDDVRLVGKCSALGIGDASLTYTLTPASVTAAGMAVTLPTITFEAPTIADDWDDEIDGEVVIDLTTVEWLSTSPSTAAGYVIRHVPDDVRLVGDSIQFYADGSELGEALDISGVVSGAAIHTEPEKVSLAAGDEFQVADSAAGWAARKVLWSTALGSVASASMTLTGKTISGASNTLSNIPQSAVTNLTTDLSGKAAASHTHAQADITNLTTDLSGKESAISAGTTAQYWRGDKSWQTLDKSAVGLGNADNTSDATKNAAAVTLTNKTISGASNTLSDIPQSAVTSLVTDLSGKAAASHTHAQSDITNLTTDLSGKESTANKGQANGYASLDSGGKVPIGQLPSSIMEYQGVWNPSTNTPTLADGAGSVGDVYRVTTGASIDLGSGAISFVTGDYVIYNGAVWERSGTTDAVSSVNGYTGTVTLSQDDVASGTTNKVFTATEQTKLAGIAAGATANSTDATLLARASHTGTQEAATISDFSIAADARIAAAVGVSVQAYDADLTAFAGKTAPTGVVVGDTDTQTLTGKTISGASNTLSNIGNSALTNSAITIAGTSTSLGGSITQDTITGLSTTGLVKRTGENTLAVATADTDFVTPSGTATLTNKTISGASNTLSSIAQSSVTNLTTDLSGKESTANKGQANGYASLDSGGKVPIGQLPSSIMEYQGVWNPSTNTPTLADGTGSPGDVYRVTATASIDLGSGAISFVTGDYVIYNGTVWEKSDTTDAVSSVNGYTGTVSLAKGDVGLGNVDNTSNATERAATATLTNKTINLTSNTLSGTISQFNTALSDADFATLAGTETLSGKTLSNPTVTNYTESVVTIGTVTTSNTLSLTDGTVQTATLTASTACTFTMPTATAGKSFVLMLKQAASTGNGTATFTGVKWPGGVAPTMTATVGAVDILSFISDGTYWYGSSVQGMS